MSGPLGSRRSLLIQIPPVNGGEKAGSRTVLHHTSNGGGEAEPLGSGNLPHGRSGRVASEHGTLPVTNAPPAMAADPMGIIAAAVQAGGLPVEQLEKLMALQERYDDRKAAQAFARAMVAAQEAMPLIVKDRENSQTRSRYASYDNVLEHCKPIWTAHGLSVSISQDDSPIKDWIRVRAVVEHIEGHSKTYFRDAPIDNAGMGGKVNKTVMHGLASTVTYMSRQLVVGIFNISQAGTDIDGNRPTAHDSITEDQAIQLGEMLEGAGVNLAAFLTWASEDMGRKVGALAELSPTTYATAKATYKSKG